MRTESRDCRPRTGDQGPEAANSKVVSEVILPVIGHRSSVMGYTRFTVKAGRIKIKNSKLWAKEKAGYADQVLDTIKNR